MTTSKLYPQTTRSSQNRAATVRERTQARHEMEPPTVPRTGVRSLTVAALCWLLLSSGCRKTPADAAALEKQFQESLSGVVLTGHFTLGRDDKLREEKYTIEKVSKIKGDLWLFQARIQYGSRDVTLPLPLRVEWAGDTPVITLTDLAIPGVGTYTARVLIYRGEYAGTWAGKGHGGHLFGRIVKKSEAGGA